MTTIDNLLTITIIVANIYYNTIIVVMFYCKVKYKKDKRCYKLFEINFDEFTLTQKHLADFILSNSDEVPFLLLMI